MPPAALLLALSSAPGRAAPPVDPFEEADESALFRAEERVVTVASRYAQAAELAPGIVTVLTDRELRGRGHRTLSDVLRSLPGVYVTVAQESRSLAWFRGVISPDNNKFLLLIDGVPWYDGIYTHAWIDEYLPLVDVKQVEIIKGPGSAVYGTNAFAGVVNVVTYRASDLQGGFARVEVGDDGRRGASAVLAEEVQLGDQSVEVRATVRALDLDGDGMDLTPRGERNVSGMNPRRALLGRFGLTAGGLDVSVAVVDYKHTYFVQPQDDPLKVLFQQDEAFWLAYRDRFVHAKYDIPLGKIGRLTPSAFWQTHDDPGQYAFMGDPETSVDPTTGEATTRFTGGLVETEKHSSRIGGSLEAELRPTAQHASIAGLGAELIQIHNLVDNAFYDFASEAQSPPDFEIRADDARISNLYGFAQHTWTTGWFAELTAGARVDLHSYFGAFVSPRAGVLLLPAEGVVLKLLYGRAFRAPTARELLVTVGRDEAGENRFVAGNPALRPEAIDTVEGELTVKPARWATLRGAAYGSFLNDQINSVRGDDPQLGTDFYENGGGTTILGGELQGVLTPGRWELDLAWTGTRAVDGPTGFAQYGFPAHMVNGRLGLEPVDGLRLNLLADLVGARPRAEWTPDSGRPDGPAYTLLHAAVATDLLAGGRLRADLSVRNLLDTAYEDLVYQDAANAVNIDDAGVITGPRYPADIAAAGRSVVVGVELAF